MTTCSTVQIESKPASSAAWASSMAAGPFPKRPRLAYRSPNFMAASPPRPHAAAAAYGTRRAAADPAPAPPRSAGGTAIRRRFATAGRGAPNSPRVVERRPPGPDADRPPSDASGAAPDRLEAGGGVRLAPVDDLVDEAVADGVVAPQDVVAIDVGHDPLRG